MTTIDTEKKILRRTLGCLIGYGLYSIVRIGYEKIR